MNKVLTVNDWNKYIYKKKIELIDTIDTIDNSKNLNTTKDSFKFNDVLKNNIVKINMFNMTYITFIMLKFLETSFIPSEIILNVMEIYSDDELQILLLKNYTLLKQTNNNYKLETYKYIRLLKYIISTIIDFVVKIELSLNIQCLLITHFIDKIHNKNTSNITNITNITNNENTYINSTINKPFFFILFSTINEDINDNIKSSTLILLFLKLVTKFNTTYDNKHLLYFVNEYNNTSFLNFINKKININKNMKTYLDQFILAITKYFLIDNNNINNIINPDIYSICNNYMLNTIELIFKNFENIYTILEIQLLESINITEKKKVKLLYLKDVIINIVNIEINKIKKIFI